MRAKLHIFLLGLTALCLACPARTSGPIPASTSSFALPPAVAAAPVTISAPAVAMVYDAVEIRVTAGEEPVAGVEFRVAAPSQTLGVVNATSLNVRTGPSTDFPIWGIVYQDDVLLVLSTTATGWCEVVVPAGGNGYSSCQFLDQQAYGQPLGRTDAQGRLITEELAVVPSQIEIRGYMDGEAVGSATICVVPYEYDFSEDVAPGIGYRERRFAINGEGPFTMQVLEVDPADPSISILPVRANDRAVTRERVSSMARRYGATVAVNGGYFVTTGAYAGASAGVYMLNREVISGGANRTALIFCDPAQSTTQTAIDVVDLRGQITAGDGATHGISGMNRARAAQDMVVYRPILGPRTLTDASGVEVIVDAKQRVVGIEDEVGSAAIPEDGAVISGTGTAAAWLRQQTEAGMTMAVNVELNPRTPPETSGCTPEHVAGGGPRVVRNGEINVTMEGFGHENARHPRTAFAVTDHGTFLFVTLDGRQSRSAGMKLNELARELIDLGAVEAMNFDGGGSTTMVVRGVLRNSPSDGSERAVSDGILVFSSDTSDKR